MILLKLCSEVFVLKIVENGITRRFCFESTKRNNISSYGAVYIYKSEDKVGSTSVVSRELVLPISLPSPPTPFFITGQVVYLQPDEFNRFNTLLLINKKLDWKEWQSK